VKPDSVLHITHMYFNFTRDQVSKVSLSYTLAWCYTVDAMVFVTIHISDHVY